MKCSSLIVLILLLNSCSSQNSMDYDQLLNGLSNNYVFIKKEMGATNFYEYYKIDRNREAKDSLVYRNAVFDFYEAPVGIVAFLLTFENETTTYVNWIHTKNPFSSRIEALDLLTKSQSALVLIDNYLANRKDTILVPAYFNKLNYQAIENFYNENKSKDKDVMRANYLEFLDKDILE